MRIFFWIVTLSTGASFSGAAMKPAMEPKERKEAAAEAGSSSRFPVRNSLNPDEDQYVGDLHIPTAIRQVFPSMADKNFSGGINALSQLKNPEEVQSVIQDVGDLKRRIPKLSSPKINWFLSAMSDLDHAQRQNLTRELEALNKAIPILSSVDIQQVALWAGDHINDPSQIAAVLTGLEDLYQSTPTLSGNDFQWIASDLFRLKDFSQLPARIIGWKEVRPWIDEPLRNIFPIIQQALSNPLYMQQFVLICRQSSGSAQPRPLSGAGALLEALVKLNKLV